MLKTIARLMLIPLGFVLLIGLCMMLWIWPTDRTVVEVSSPDGRFMATVVDAYSGGALGSVQTRITLEDRRGKSGWPFSSYERKDVLRSFHGVEVNLSWRDETTLVVQYETYRSNSISSLVEEWKDVKIVYREAK